ncbi:hypothetical protein PAXRUDRAFT_168153, partial [Paxillus rubicundulus Ve08.2h10]
DCAICGKAMKHKSLCSHTGGHILHAQMGIKEDHLVTQVTVGDPCGFCRQSGHPVQLTKEGKKRTFQLSSSCPLAITFSLGAAATSTKNSPSTNVPIHCSICPATSGDCVIFRAAQVNSASPEPTPDQVRFLRPPFLRISAFSLTFSFLCLDFLSFTSLTDV